MIIRIVAGLLLAAVLALQYRLWVSPNGMRDVWRTEKAIAVQVEENARLKERNRTLAAEVRDLKEGRAAIEERARTDLGMIGSNETFFQVVPPDPHGRPGSRRAAADRAGRTEMNRRARRWAVVVAAGRGERFGGSHSQAIRAAARPARARVVAGRAPRDRRPWTAWSWRSRRATGAGSGSRSRAIRASAPAPAAIAARPRWPTRSLALASLARDDDWVIVHDAARPCLRREDLDALISATRGDPVGGLLAVPVPDTLKVDDGGGRSVRTADRTGLWRALTPQMFRYGLLRRALALCIERERSVTDEASAVEALGLRPQAGAGTRRQHQAHDARRSRPRRGDPAGREAHDEGGNRLRRARLRARRPRDARRRAHSA